MSKVEFLGHVVSGEGVEMDSRKVTAILDWPVPTNRKELMSFLGLIGFYRKFLKHFSDVAVPLTNLTGREVVWSWGAQEDRAFKQLKSMVCEAPVLVAPDMSKPFRLECDASKFATGAVLLQEQDQVLGFQPIAFISKKLSKHEVNYPMHEKELLAIIRALKEWRCYCHGSKFPISVKTDNKSLTYLETQPHLSERQVRWLQFLADYDLTTDYIPGTTNVVADFLSRRPDLLGAMSVSQVCGDDEILDSCRWGYAKDPFYSGGAAAKHKRLELQPNGLWMHGSRVAVPNDPELRNRILWELHRSTEGGHLGSDKLVALAKRYFWWPGWTVSCRGYAQSCDECQRNKPRNTLPLGTAMPVQSVTHPFQQVSMDLITGLPLSEGYDALVVFVDTFTKYIILVPVLKTCSASDMARVFISHLYSSFGLPEVLISDRDPRFTSGFWQSVFRHLGTKLHMSTAFHPESDGQTERANRTVLEMLRAFLNPRQDNWVSFLPTLQFAYNNSEHASTGFTPFFLNHGRHPHTALSRSVLKDHKYPVAASWLSELQAAWAAAGEAITRAKSKQAKQISQRRTAHEFAVGDLVLLDTLNLSLPASRVRKLSARFVGPFKVLKAVNRNAYKLDLPPSFGRTHPVFNISYLKPYVVDPNADAGSRPAPVLVDGHEEYFIDQILGESKGRGPKRYCVLWKGYQPEDATWVPARNLKDTEALDKWLQLKKSKKSATTL